MFELLQWNLMHFFRCESLHGVFYDVFPYRDVPKRLHVLFKQKLFRSSCIEITISGTVLPEADVKFLCTGIRPLVCARRITPLERRSLIFHNHKDFMCCPVLMYEFPCFQ